MLEELSFHGCNMLTRGSEKHMITIRWSEKGPLTVERLDPDELFNSTYFTTVIRRKFIQELCPEEGHVDEKLMGSILRMLNLVIQHLQFKVWRIILTLRNLKIIRHPSDSPDVALNHFYLFGTMKHPQ
jgi:hypothetical protein